MAVPRIFVWTVVLLFVGVAIAPLAYLFISPLLEGSGHISIEDVFEYRHLFLAAKSLVIALGTSLLSLFAGAGLAFLLCKTDMPGKKWLGYIFVTPLLIPPYIHALAWSYISPLIKTYTGFELYSIWGVIWVLTLAWFPVITLTTMAGLRSIDPRMEEASLLIHGPFATASKITLPLCLPHIICGTIFVFVFAITNTGVSDILRVRVYPLEIFIQFSAFFDTGKAVILSLPIILLTLFFIILQQLYMGDKSFISGTGGNKNTLFFPTSLRTTLLFSTVSHVPVAGAALVPLCVLLIKAGGVSTYYQALTSSWEPFLLSSCLALGAALFSTLLGNGLGYLMQRLNNKSRFFLSLLTVSPLAVPTSALGIGIIGLWNRYPVDLIYSSPVIMILAYVGKFTSYSAIIFHAAFGRVNQRMEEAAALAGIHFFRIYRSILAKLTFRQGFVAFFVVYILSFRELGTTLLISPPGVETIPVKIYNLMHYGAQDSVAALCLIQMFTILFLFAVILRLNFWDGEQ